MVNTILKEADLFCPNSVRINFTIYLSKNFQFMFTNVNLVLTFYVYRCNLKLLKRNITVIT
ncbi:protein of unknown function (plasmid) [Latilactobacillus sakei]|nr:protein of unknown function [Latilactobacillus sakei]